VGYLRGLFWIWDQIIMGSSVRTTLEIALASLLISAAIAGAALAQGSAGGSIGNDEKSLSGSRQAPRSVEPEKPARRSKPEAARKSGGGGSGVSKFDGVWLVTAVGCGSTTTSTVVVSGGRVSGGGATGTINASGVGHSVGIYDGVTVTGTSFTSGNRGTGTFRASTGCTGTVTSIRQ
jgi:hypothetical protein